MLYLGTILVLDYIILCDHGENRQTSIYKINKIAPPIERSIGGAILSL